MPKKIALDYDDSELRIVTANCSGSKVQVTDARVIPIPEGDTVSQCLRAYVSENGLQKTETLVVIGRGKAELRELRLPRVPDEELPDMVRFQAIRSFASSSDKAIVDFLVTGYGEENVTLIAAAVSPQELQHINELCRTSDLTAKRVALRPLTAASLYLRVSKPPQICVMIDLLADDAEIVIARAGKVIFVRTVRLPGSAEYRSKAIASELHRTMVACGETSTPDRIVVWGRQAVHEADLQEIRSKVDCQDVQAVDPFDLVSLQTDHSSLPDHVGRLAPLVGLLASDEAAPETLIDFVNPRERPVEEPDRVRRLLLIAGPLAAVFLLGFFAYQQIASWDRRIAAATEEVNLMRPTVDAADESIARTELIDQFLDQDVNWLDELKRFAEKAPPSDQLIVKSIVGSADSRNGAALRISGAVTELDVIDGMEEALRDETHSIVGKGTQQQDKPGAYQYTFTETITIANEDLRNVRYARLAEAETPVESEPAAAAADAVVVSETENKPETEPPVESDTEPAAESEPAADGDVETDNAPAAENAQEIST